MNEFDKEHLKNEIEYYKELIKETECQKIKQIYKKQIEANYKLLIQ